MKADAIPPRAEVSSEPNHPGRTLRTERLLFATPEQIFAAFERPGCLAQWWGPHGFTNTFELFEFRQGGRWVFKMHGPNGTNYHNESVFQEITRNQRVVIEHIVTPWYRLIITLSADAASTRLTWEQEFESPEFAAKLRSLASTANEQVLDRLQAIVDAQRIDEQR